MKFRLRCCAVAIPLAVSALLMLSAACSARRDLNGSAGARASATRLDDPAERAAQGTEVPSGTVSEVRPPSREERESMLLEALAEYKPGIPSQALPDKNIRVNQDTTAREQNETTIAVNPNDPLHLVAGWNNFFSDGWGEGSKAGHGWSFDGGETWESTKISNPYCPAEYSICDPSMAFDNLGNVFFGLLGCGCWVARSGDGGRTFDNFTYIGGSDKPYVATNPQNNDVYASYVDSHDTYGSFTVYFLKSTDQGTTFSDPVTISNGDSVGNGSLVRAGTNGEIYITWSNAGPGDGDRVYFDRSLDGGTTWLDDDIQVATGIVAPPFGLGGFRNPNIPSMAVDWSNGPYRGRIYVIFADARYGDPDIMLVRSDDGGSTWSAPVRVNDDTVGNGAHQWFPWISVDDDGHVHVTFLDRRDDADNYLYAAYLATSTDGGASFGPNIRLSDGFYGPGFHGFLGDYTGNATGGGKLYAAWPDARFGDADIYLQAVDLADFDDDGILNDGSGDGQYSSAPCTGGQTAGCDDNCPGVSNPDQSDSDGDGVGDLCDNCPDDVNADQDDVDRDGFGDACDACAGVFGGDGGDPDGDGVVTCDDNCPDHANAGQADDDADNIGNACDPCPGDDINDEDGDGLCATVDNCPQYCNPGQVDSDEDGFGEPCDTCPDFNDPGQADTDGDGRGDACDCQYEDPGDRTPPDTNRLRAFHDGTTTHFALRYGPYDDLFSVVRGSLASLRSSGDYGNCFLNGVEDLGFDDTEVPPSGDGFFYLVQGHNLDCGMGTIGFDSEGAMRQPSGACDGVSHQDVYPISEVTSTGIRSGDYTLTFDSDDVYETITEATSGAMIALYHEWTFDVPAGDKVWLHFEGFRTEETPGESFIVRYSPSGGEGKVVFYLLDTADRDSDLSYGLPLDAVGTVYVRIADSTPFETVPAEDTVSVDQLWIRVVP